jgi:hypothetical protein
MLDVLLCFLVIIGLYRGRTKKGKKWRREEISKKVGRKKERKKERWKEIKKIMKRKKHLL